MQLRSSRLSQRRPCLPQEAEAQSVIECILSTFHRTLWFKSMHAAFLVPRRLANWVEGASKLAAPQALPMLEAVATLVVNERPSCVGAPAEAPGLVSVLQWREGAVQLQQEVRHRACSER
jgi:hypothetical protein